ncbi:MAG: CopG family transcriptional regulator [Desulfobacterales bacterium]|jgi:predicted transcriptional regulator
MPTETKRATIYMDAELHRALRMKAAETCSSISEIVNHAVKLLLAEDAEVRAAIEERAKEPLFSFEDVLKELKRKGRI